MRTKLTKVLAAVALLSCLTIFAPGQAKADTLIVDDNMACDGASYSSIQSAVNAASAGDTIRVCAGTYTENVTIPDTKSDLTLEGAQANQPYGGRAFGVASESTVNGTITIAASGVSVNGFSITKTSGGSGIFGVHIQATGHDATIINNIFDTIVNSFASGGSAQAIYLQGGPDNVRIEDNRINNVQSFSSAKGILVGDNGVANPSEGTIIEGNLISNITSQRGAYGISVARAGGMQHTDLLIRDNNIKNLTGTWVHAIGLEGDTPGAIVTGNCFSNLAVTSGIDNAAVFFEFNPSADTVEVHLNNFDVTPAAFGILLHHTNQPLLTIDGEYNYWGSPSGPTTLSNPGGTGAQAHPSVDFSPFLAQPPAGGACGGVEAKNGSQCKNNGWKTVLRADGSSFKNQGDCMQYVNTGK